jgi:hypothetical protein
MLMKRLYPVILPVSLILLFSCKKFIQQQEEKAVVSDVTNGLWYVSGYKQNDSDITSSFSGYLFKFDANNTVTGSWDGDSSMQGNWTVDINAKTIYSDFPGAGAPLSYLNETWLITDSYTDSVSAKATDTVSHTSNILQLKKQ